MVQWKDRGVLLTVVVNHDFNITEDLAVSPVGFFAGLRQTAQILSVKGPMGLRVQHEWDRQQPLDPFWLSGQRQLCIAWETHHLPGARLSCCSEALSYWD
jgi:hypothetical protein